MLEQFAKYFGLTPNFDKTKAIWIGSKIHSKERLCKDKKLSWTDESFDILGITFNTNLDEIEKLNFDKKLRHVEKLIKEWEKRNITVLGKITVVKTLLIPILTHLFKAIPNPSLVFLKKLEGILYRYIWNGNDKIARNLMVQDFSDGGCSMVHLESFVKSLKITWIRRIFSNVS